MTELNRYSQRKDQVTKRVRITLHSIHKVGEGTMLKFVDCNNAARFYHVILDADDTQLVDEWFNGGEK